MPPSSCRAPSTHVPHSPLTAGTGRPGRYLVKLGEKEDWLAGLAGEVWLARPGWRGLAGEVGWRGLVGEVWLTKTALPMSGYIWSTHSKRPARVAIGA